MGDELRWSAKRSRANMQNHLGAFTYIASALHDGLSGKPFHWGDGERQAYTKKALAMGATLLTRNQISARGYELKRGAKAVGTAYFGAPIGNGAELFILEVQCKKVRDDE